MRSIGRAAVFGAACIALVAAECSSSVDDGLIPEEAAIDVALERLAALPEMELTGKLENPSARRMTWGEFQDRFDDGRDSRDPEIPVWAVQVEGTWRGAGITPPEARTPWSGYAAVAVNARDGTMLAAGFVDERVGD